MYPKQAYVFYEDKFDLPMASQSRIVIEIK